MQAKPDTDALIHEIYRAIEIATNAKLTDLSLRIEQKLRQDLTNLILPVMEEFEQTSDRYDDLQADSEDLEYRLGNLEDKLSETTSVVIFFQPGIEATNLSWTCTFIRAHLGNYIEAFLPGITKNGKAKTSEYRAVYVCTNQNILEMIKEWTDEDRYVKIHQEAKELYLQFCVNEEKE
jgi:hypothetical protein